MLTSLPAVLNILLIPGIIPKDILSNIASGTAAAPADNKLVSAKLFPVSICLERLVPVYCAVPAANPANVAPPIPATAISGANAAAPAATKGTAAYGKEEPRSSRIFSPGASDQPFSVG